MSFADVANQYCMDVSSGKVLACQFVKYACRRHLEDIEKSKEEKWPYEFNPGIKDHNGRAYHPAERVCNFAEAFTHVKGKWAGGKIKLEAWEVFILSCLFGWVRKKDKLRRFRVAYSEIPRKNGKSVIAAVVGNYMVSIDGESGAEVYSGATTEKQALEVFRPAWQMASRSDSFREAFGISLSGTPRNPTSIYRLEDMSRFEPLIGHPGEGASPHCAIIDEYHEHKSSAQYDSMETGMGAREQPLMFVITTAGVDTSGPCYDMHTRAIKVLDGSIGDDSFFAIIFTVDPEADWKDFDIWKAANPNYGVSINQDYLKRKYKETLTNAAKQNINLCKHLNQWTNAGIAWMNMVKWSACADPSLRIEDFQGETCYAALDLASRIDMCALILLFTFDRGYACFGKYYLPEETIHLAGNEHYVKWVKEGWITETPGARTDFAYIEDDLKAIHAVNPIKELAFDPREATYLIADIMEWMSPESCIEINQGPALMSQPMKELEALIYSQKIWFNGDPVLTWMMGNVVKKQGRATGPVKYYYPTKEKNENKIDGAVSLIMALSRAMLHAEVKSVYDGLSADEIIERMAL